MRNSKNLIAGAIAAALLSTAPLDAAWAQVALFTGEWQSERWYESGIVVTYHGVSYLCLARTDTSRPIATRATGPL